MEETKNENINFIGYEYKDVTVVHGMEALCRTVWRVSGGCWREAQLL